MSVAHYAYCALWNVGTRTVGENSDSDRDGLRSCFAPQLQEPSARHLFPAPSILSLARQRQPLASAAAATPVPKPVPPAPTPGPAPAPALQAMDDEQSCKTAVSASFSRVCSCGHCGSAVRACRSASFAQFVVDLQAGSPLASSLVGVISPSFGQTGFAPPASVFR